MFGQKFRQDIKVVSSESYYKQYPVLPLFIINTSIITKKLQVPTTRNLCLFKYALVAVSE